MSILRIKELEASLARRDELIAEQEVFIDQLAEENRKLHAALEQRRLEMIPPIADEI